MWSQVTIPQPGVGDLRDAGLSRNPSSLRHVKSEVIGATEGPRPTQAVCSAVRTLEAELIQQLLKHMSKQGGRAVISAMQRRGRRRDARVGPGTQPGWKGVVLLLVVGLTLAWTDAVAGAHMGKGTAAVAPSPTSTPESVKFYVVSDPRNGEQEYPFGIAAKTLGDGKRYLEIFALNQGRLQPDGQRMTDPSIVNPGWILQLPPDATGPSVQEGTMPYVAPIAAPPPRSGSGVGGGQETIVRVLGVAAMVVLVGLAVRLLRRGIRIPRPRRLSTAYAEGNPALPLLAAPYAVPAGGQPQRAAARAAVTEPNKPRTFIDSVLNTEVTDGIDVITVRLAGAGAGARARSGRPYGWVAAGNPRPMGLGVVRIGVRGGDTLFVDLSMSPDVITITGPASGRFRLVHSFARQLEQARVSVTVVGNAAGEAIPVGAMVVSSYDELVGRSPATLGVIFGVVENNRELPHIRRLVPNSDRRTILVIVGDTRRARWSMDVHSGQ